MQKTCHECVYTYDHAANILYQGKNPIKEPAVMALPCLHSIPYITRSNRVLIKNIHDPQLGRLLDVSSLFKLIKRFWC